MKKSFFKQFQNFANHLIRSIDWHGVSSVLLLAMFVIGYFESFRWSLPGPRGTHGILKGLGLIALVMMVVLKKKFLPLKHVRLNLLMLLFLFSYVISTLFSQGLDASLLNLWYPFLAFIIINLFSKIQFSKKYISLFILIAVVLIFITFAFSFFSLMFRYSVDNLYYFLFLDHRANHLLQEIRFYGKYVSLGPYIMLLPLSLVFLLKQGKVTVRKLLSFFILLVALLTAVISNNRIDVLVFGIQFLLLLFLIPKREAVVMLLPILFISWFGLFVTNKYFGFNLEQRILRPKLERDIETIDIRFTYWKTALYNFQNNPIVGTGPNTYNEISEFPLRRYFDRGVNQYTVRQDEGIGVHNVFFERLSDTGALGFFSFIFLLLYFFRQDALALWQIGYKHKESFGYYALFSLSSWSWILYSLTDNGYGAQGFITFFFLRGLINHLQDS